MPLPQIVSAADQITQLDGPGGPTTLPELFDGRCQLVVYHFRLEPGGSPCAGCSSFVDNVGRLERLHARGTTFVLTSRASLEEIEAVRQRIGWTVPWYSTFGHDDFGGDLGEDSGSGLYVFLRDGDEVYRTYPTASRSVDRLWLDFDLLDLWRLHDEY